MMGEQSKDFDRGVRCGVAAAAAIVMRERGDSNVAFELLETVDLMNDQDLKDAGVDEYDIEALAPVLKEIATQ